jgi:hypothetical protein
MTSSSPAITLLHQSTLEEALRAFSNYALSLAIISVVAQGAQRFRTG